MAGYVVEQLRRIPGVAWGLRHGGMVAGVLAVVAALAFVWWASQAAPQPVGLADLVQAKLSPMQTWIVIRGDVSGGEFLHGTYRYAMTDPAVPNAQLNIISEVQLPLGPQAVSGSYVGGLEPLPIGFRWVAQMRADAVFTPEPGPPWITIVLGAVALFLGLCGRLSYPRFIPEPSAGAALAPRTMAVGVRRGTSASAGPVVPATLRVQPGSPVGMRAEGGAEEPLRIYSTRTSVEVGRLQGLSASEPALRVHKPTGDLDISFATPADRDSVYAALAADSDLSGTPRMTHAAAAH
jgi:hypothetical protein